MKGLIAWQRVEGAIVFGAATAMFIALDSSLSWWAALLVFFAPDLSFAAYLLGPRPGAFAYNAVHLYAFGVSVLAIGLGLGSPVVAGVGALLTAHSGFDRMLGYGLKSTTGFRFTHLGDIGQDVQG